MFAAGAEIDVLPGLAAYPHSPIQSGNPPPKHDSEDHEEATGLTRAASFTQLQGSADPGPGSDLKRTISETVLSLPSAATTRPNGAVHNANKELFRRSSRKARKGLSASRFIVSTDHPLSYGASDGVRADGVERPKTPGRSVADTFRSLARKTWITSSSRSPSPSKRTPRKLESSGHRSPTRKSSVLASSTPIAPPTPPVARRSPQLDDDDDDNIPQTPKRTIPVPSQTPNLKEKSRPLSSILAKNKSESSLRLSRTSSLLSLRSRASLDRLKVPSDKVPPIPTSISTDRLSAFSIDVAKRKDPLWSAFRTLDGDFQKYQTKPISLKANVIRTCLLPFLGRYAHHPSNRIIRAEDLDRRIVILNKWWIGLLEMLNGNDNQSISGIDRPVFLNAVTGIMVRPEWRAPPFPSLTPSDTPPSNRPSIPKSRSTTSFDSSGSDLLTDSIYQNVRNVFVQNLLSQMDFVVDKMSMRTAPASLVAFCGKVCAYAFFYCPGIADILVRLWHIPQESLRRIFDEFGISRGTNLALTSKQISPFFPPPLRSLSVTSRAAFVRYLNQKAPHSLATAGIRWYGPWISRWTGRDSDLLFVFTKHFHLLVAEFMPSSADRRDRACVPGLVPVHAQLLTILETTLYRQANQVHAESFASSTVDDVDNLDAAAPLPMTTANAVRSMAENRLIMLLRDVLADHDPEHSELRELFAESFSDITKAAARKISLYNNDACFVLCDFMEEVLTITSRYHSSHEETPALDWPFWRNVCRLMTESHNTLTEIRLFSFLYSIWNILIVDEQRKWELCFDWLLEPVFFDAHFNHWCPMVRHYFHRLLCWRMARYDGDASDVDEQIFETLAARLNTSWAHYQYLRAEAEMRNSVLPSSAPCSPAPARRLIIIRIDSQPVPAANLLASFEKLISPHSSNQATPYKMHSSVLNTMPPVDSPAQIKKRWSIVKTFLGSPGNSRPGEVTPPGNAEDSPVGENTNLDGLSARIGSTKPALSRPGTPPHQPFSFKFSLEWLERPTWPTKNKRLTAPLLPAPAQELLHSMHPTDGRLTPEVKPKKPRPEELNTAKYAGRALAEWSLIVAECQNFFERRREEGVPSNRLVETPVLGVESFRMYG